MAEEAPEKQLTPKQAAFVREYLVDLNATQAAIRAGYSERTARQVGAENLAKPVIKAAIGAAMSERAEKTAITAERVLEELAAMAFYDPAELCRPGALRGPEDIAALPEPVRRCIVGWGWDRNNNFTLKLADKQGALSLLGKHLKLFAERYEVDMKIDLVDRLKQARERAMQ